MERENVLEKSIASTGTKIQCTSFPKLPVHLFPPETGDDTPGLDYKGLQEESRKAFTFIKPHLEKQALQVLQSKNPPFGTLSSKD